MGYIELPSGAPSTKKAVISIWFRVPETSIAAATAEYQEWANGGAGGAAPPMLGVIPLMVFGPPSVARNYKANNVTDGSYEYQNWSVGSDNEGGIKFTLVFDDSVPTGTTQYEWAGGTTPIDPSYIGVDCSGAYPALSVNIVMPSSNLATMDGGVSFGIGTTTIDGQAGIYTGIVQACGPVEGGPLPDTFTSTTTADHSGASFALGGYPETFRLLPTRGRNWGWDYANYTNFQGAQITPNHWHHLLLSFDLTNGISLTGNYESRNTTSPCRADLGGVCWEATYNSYSYTNGAVSKSCKMYVALDDQNITGSALTAYRGAGAGPNDIITVNGFWMYNDLGYDLVDAECVRFGRTEIDVGIVAKPTYSYVPSAVPFAEGVVAFPASAAHVGQVKHVEMAEFQMFTGVSLDTGNVGSRRAFITQDGLPAPMSDAADFLGKDPEIKLHGSGNWKSARNTGTYGAAPPDGDHTGDIKTYRPNPSLNGKQGAPQ